MCRRRAARRAAVAPSSGRLWAGTAVTVLTSRPARALGRALHSPGLDGPPPWLRGRCSLCCSAPAVLIKGRTVPTGRHRAPSPEALQWSSLALDPHSGMPWQALPALNSVSRRSTQPLAPAQSHDHSGTLEAQPREHRLPGPDMGRMARSWCWRGRHRYRPQPQGAH